MWHGVRKRSNKNNFCGVWPHNEHILTILNCFLKVPSTVGMLFAQKHGCLFYEISAKTSKNLIYFDNYFFSKWFVIASQSILDFLLFFERCILQNT